MAWIPVDGVEDEWNETLDLSEELLDLLSHDKSIVIQSPCIRLDPEPLGDNVACTTASSNIANGVASVTVENHLSFELDSIPETMGTANAEEQVTIDTISGVCKVKKVRANVQRRKEKMKGIP